MQVTLNRQLLGVEDIAFGTSTRTQIRGGVEVTITELNAGNLPFNETQTLIEALTTAVTEAQAARDTILNMTVVEGPVNTEISWNPETGILTIPTVLSITSITRTLGDGSPGTIDTYTITFTDNSTTTFNVYNGADGVQINDDTPSITTAYSGTKTQALHDLQAQSIANIEDRLGSAIASAATITIGTAGLGDTIHITGTTTITSLGTAAQAGVRRTLVFDGALTLTHSSSLICPGAASITTVAGMAIEVIAESTSVWRVVKVQHPSVTVAQIGYLAGLTSDAQTQINSKVDKVTTVDNCIMRADGTSGGIQASSITIDDNGNVGNGTQTFNGFGGNGFKNYIINGSFDVWQRGTSFTGLTNGSYSTDRWVVYDSTGDINYNVIRNAGIFTGGYGASYTWNSGTGQRSIIQFIENVTRFKVGSSVTVSFEAYTNSTPYSINVVLQGVRGAWESATAVVASPIALTNTKTKYSVTLSVPDWSSIGIDWTHLEDTKLALKFDFAADTNGKDFIISNVQLEEGSVATPFEQRPYGLELSLCQRYGELIQSSSIQCSSSAFTGTARVHAQYSYKATKRVIPSVSTPSWSTLNCATPFIFANTTDQITYTADALTGGNVAFNNMTPIFLDAEL